MASIQKRPDGRWRARYRDEAGKEHAKHFARKLEAKRRLDEVTTSIITGQYVDPRAGTITFQEYAEQWRAAMVHRPSSAAYVEGVLRRHVDPIYGARPIGSILPSEIQDWVKLLGTGDRAPKRKPLAPATISVIHGVVSGDPPIGDPGPENHRKPLRGHPTGSGQTTAGHAADDQPGRGPARRAARRAQGHRHLRRRHQHASG